MIFIFILILLRNKIFNINKRCHRIPSVKKIKDLLEDVFRGNPIENHENPIEKNVQKDFVKVNINHMAVFQKMYLKKHYQIIIYATKKDFAYYQKKQSLSDYQMEEVLFYIARMQDYHQKKQVKKLNSVGSMKIKRILIIFLN